MVLYCSCKGSDTSKYKAVTKTYNRDKGEVHVRCTGCNTTSPYKNIEDVHYNGLGWI